MQSYLLQGTRAARKAVYFLPLRAAANTHLGDGRALDVQPSNIYLF